MPEQMVAYLGCVERGADADNEDALGLREPGSDLLG
jgi:hypothetical protein